MICRRGAHAALAVALVTSIGACTSHHRPPVYNPGAVGIGDPYFPRAGNGGYHVSHYDLAVTYDPAANQLSGTATLTATATANLSQFDLDLSGLTVRSTTVDGAAARFETGHDELVITPATHLANGTGFTVVVRYDGKPGGSTLPGTNAPTGFLHDSAGATAVGEPQSAAFWYPVNDHPLDKASYSIAVTVPTGWQAVSNGVLTGTSAAGTSTTYRWREDAPMAPYLSTLAIGHFRIQTASWRGIPIYSAVATTLPSSVDSVVARLPELVDFLSSQFGPYPFDALGVIVPEDDRLRFALETQTRPVVSVRFFNRSDPTAAVMHELAHQWFGDSVSVHYWRDIWLNEGFATYAQWLWSAHTGGETPRQTFDNLYSGGSVIFDPPPGDPGVDALFAPSVYQRGAMTLQALRMSVGDAAFFRILRDWVASRRGGNGDIADFIALADRDAGKSVDALLDTWLFQPGKPPRPNA